MGRQHNNGSKWDRVGGCGLDASGSRYGQVVGPCEHDCEPLDSIIDSKFLD
jgi:hypothetical protein